MPFFATIRRGNRAAVWSRTGEVHIVDGPRRILLLGRSFQPLVRYSASPEEYLVIVAKDGTTQHLRGPASTWFDPVVLESIRTAPLLRLDANEAIVVYRPVEGRVVRRIERGPALFMPAPDEWLHHFSWHGADLREPTVKLPRALQFEKLRVIPDQMYFDVHSVRTADDALLVVKVMVFFELIDIGRMLDQTHDPIGDFINSLTADVVDFAATLGFETFKEKTEALNQLTTYPQLVRRAESIGYRISKVVYRGYTAGETLQEMHNRAIEARTRLRLESETERQAQDLADLKQNREAARERERRDVERQRIEHQNNLQSIELQARLQRELIEQEQELAFKNHAQQSELENQRSMHREQIEFLKGAADLKVDITRYLVAQYQHPDKIVRIESARAEGEQQIHLHETGA